MTIRLLPPSCPAGPRFRTTGEEVVLDTATGLYWTRSANPLTFPLD
jgi:hypothetical protein